MTLSHLQLLQESVPSPPHIHLVHHLIERCLLFYMDQEECVASLEKHAHIQPLVTRAVWKVLEKANHQFFDDYFQRRKQFLEDKKVLDQSDILQDDQQQ